MPPRDNDGNYAGDVYLSMALTLERETIVFYYYLGK